MTSNRGPGVSPSFNPFFYMTMLFGVAFLITSTTVGVMMMADSPMPAQGPEVPIANADLVVLDTETGTDHDLGVEVPAKHVDDFRLHLADGMATWFYDDEFTTYDLERDEIRDSYGTDDFDPRTGDFITDGDDMVYYSSASNSVFIRKDLENGGSDAEEVFDNRDYDPPRLMDADGDSFYWVADHVDDAAQSTVFRYDPATEEAEWIMISEDHVRDMDVHDGKIALEILDDSRYRGTESEVVLYDMSNENRTWQCGDCSIPRLGGDMLAVREEGGIMVKNLSTGDERHVEEPNDILEIRTDGDKLAWSWIPHFDVDPITIMDLETGEEVTYRPDDIIYTFSMDGENILLLESQQRASMTRAHTISQPAWAGLLPVVPLLFAGMVLSGLGTILFESKIRKDRREDYLDWMRHNYGHYYSYQFRQEGHPHPGYPHHHHNYNYNYTYGPRPWI